MVHAANVSLNIFIGKNKVTTLIQKNLDLYEGEGMSMEREFGMTPNNNDMGGKWVLRDKNGAMVDFDQYRTDLAERCNIRLS